jgi:hypothetical protein
MTKSINARFYKKNVSKIHYIKGRQVFSEELLNEILENIEVLHETSVEAKRKFFYRIAVTTAFYIEDWEEINNTKKPSLVQKESRELIKELGKVEGQLNNFRSENNMHLMHIFMHIIEDEMDKKGGENEHSKYVWGMNEFEKLMINFSQSISDITKLANQVSQNMERIKKTYRRNPRQGKINTIAALAITYKDFTGIQPNYVNPNPESVAQGLKSSDDRGGFYNFVITIFEKIHENINEKLPKETIGKIIQEITKDYKVNPQDYELFY